MKQNRLNSFLSSVLSAGLIATSALAFTACGKQAFVPSTSTAGQSAAGGQNVPPKIDIVLGMSSNGTMRNIYSGVSSEIPTFLTNIQNSGWDYRFVSIPLSQYHPTTQGSLSIDGAVSVSNYDGNYYSLGSWLSPYPGADPTTVPSILSSLWAQAFDVAYMNPSDPVDAHETGFNNQLNFLNRSDVQANVLRPDAMLAVVTVSNGDDRSDWNWGATGTTNLGTATYDPSYYAAAMRTVKNGSASLVKYYSVVAHLTTTCRGYGDWSGIRYEQMAADLNGKSVDICTVSVADSLSTISGDLNTYRLSFEKKYLVIGTAPNAATISVTKTSNGATTTLAQSSTNGWTYAGAVADVNPSGVYTIDSPVNMDLVTTGYLIELHGSAKLTGTDTANVTYQNAGSVSSN